VKGSSSRVAGKPTVARMRAMKLPGFYRSLVECERELPNQPVTNPGTSFRG
jgi:hypothetical protein